MGKFLVDDGCWEWTASKNSAGYGQMHAGPGRGPVRAHRVLYELLVGPIPEGLTIDHLCRNRGCVNPAHMEPVTRGENVKRGTVGEVNRARMLGRTHCKFGHEFSPENTDTRYGTRRCVACMRRRARDYQRRKRKATV